MPITDFTAPPRLAVGSHPHSTTYMCAMNVLSWENGDKRITDMPSCTPRPLASMVQLVNDRLCTHITEETDPRTGENIRVLCAPCSVTMLRLAHNTVGAPDLTVGRGWGWTADLLTRSLSDLRSSEDARVVSQAITVATAHAEGRTPDCPTPMPVRLTMSSMAELAFAIVADELVNHVKLEPTFDKAGPIAMYFAGGHLLSQARPVPVILEGVGRTFAAGCLLYTAGPGLADRAQEAIDLWISNQDKAGTTLHVAKEPVAV